MNQIQSPTLLVDEDKCRRNIRHMATKARESNVIFRPHFKTHQSHAIGRWFREAGVEKITVSSLSMAHYFARDGWKDIMVAFPVNTREISLINQLAADLNLSVLISDMAVLPALEKDLEHTIGFFIKIDVGNFRCGYYSDQVSEITSLLEAADRNPKLDFRGFVAHAGQTYQTQSLNEVQKIYNTGARQLTELTEFFRARYPGIIASWGDTPTCSLMNSFDGIDEIRPGNFVFYDLTQFHLASCDWENIAITVAAPVVSRQKQRDEIVIYCGAVHLSKDQLMVADGEIVYGEVVRLVDDEWERFPEPFYINRISQEHGIFRCPQELWDEFMPGSLVAVIPVHSCLANNLLMHKGHFNLKTSGYLV